MDPIFKFFTYISLVLDVFFVKRLRLTSHLQLPLYTLYCTFEGSTYLLPLEQEYYNILHTSQVKIKSFLSFKTKVGYAEMLHPTELQDITNEFTNSTFIE